MKEGDRAMTFDLNRKLFKNMINMRFRATVNKNGVAPSISFSSAQLSPLNFDASYNFASSMFQIGFKKDLQ